MIGVATAAWQVGAFRLAAWTARGLRVPSRNALLADIVPPEAYGRAYGFERAMDNLGAIAGPLLALVLVSLIGVRTAILVSVVPGLLAAVAIFIAIRQAPRFSTRTTARIRIRLRPLLRGPLGRLLLAMSVLELGNAAATLLILRATQALTPSFGLEPATQIALGLYVGYNTLATLASIPAGFLSDRQSPVAVVAIGALLFAGAYLSFTGATFLLLMLGFGLAGIGIGCLETGQHAAVAALAPEALRGSAFGLLAAVQSFGASLQAPSRASCGPPSHHKSHSFIWRSVWASAGSVSLQRSGRERRRTVQRPIERSSCCSSQGTGWLRRR